MDSNGNVWQEVRKEADTVHFVYAVALRKQILKFKEELSLFNCTFKKYNFTIFHFKTLYIYGNIWVEKMKTHLRKKSNKHHCIKQTHLLTILLFHPGGYTCTNYSNLKFPTCRFINL